MKINVYSTPTCPYCHQLKDFLKEHDIEFNDFDVSTDQAAAAKMVEKTGQMGVPVTEIGDEFIVGFDEAKIREKLNIK